MYFHNKHQISVILAVYNGEKYLGQSIRSILSQTFTNFELIIVNDGSTDSTGKIISSFKDKRIRVINNETNLGLPKSLNKAIKISQGDFIAINDHDDIPGKERLEKQLKFILSNPNVSLVTSAVIIIDEEGRRLGFKDVPETEPQSRLEFLFNNPVVHSTVLMNKRVATELGGYDESLIPGCDYELWSKMLREGYKIAYLKEPLVYFRVVRDSLTKTRRANMDRYVSELATIVRRNISRLAKIDLSREEAEEISKVLNYPSSLNAEELEKATRLFNFVLDRFQKHISNLNLNQKSKLRETIAKFKYLLALANIEKGIISTARKELIYSIRMHPFRMKPIACYLLSFFGPKTVKFVRQFKKSR